MSFRTWRQPNSSPTRFDHTMTLNVSLLVSNRASMQLRPWMYFCTVTQPVRVRTEWVKKNTLVQTKEVTKISIECVQITCNYHIMRFLDSDMPSCDPTRSCTESNELHSKKLRKRKSGYNFTRSRTESNESHAQKKPPEQKKDKTKSTEKKSTHKDANDPAIMHKHAHM